MIAEKIKKLRLNENLTQKQLAEKIQSTSKNIWAYENEIATPPADILLRLANFFDVSVDYLLGREDDLGNVKKQDVLSEEDKDILNQLHALGPFELEAIKIQIKALADAKKSDALTHGKK